jgi:hypothetical protein
MSAAKAAAEEKKGKNWYGGQKAVGQDEIMAAARELFRTPEWQEKLKGDMF